MSHRYHQLGKLQKRSILVQLLKGLSSGFRHLFPTPPRWNLENRYPHCLVQFDPDMLYDIEGNSGCEVHQTSVDEHPGEHPDASTVCEDDISDVNEDVLEALNLEDPQKDTEEDKKIASVMTLWEIQVSCKTMSKYLVV